MYNKLRFKNITIIIGLILFILLIIFNLVMKIVKKNNTNIEIFNTQNGSSSINSNNKDSILICSGDSILDNNPYVPVNKSVVDYMRLHVPIIKIAKDGDKITDIYNQLRRIPYVESSNMIIILSVGGNDLLEYEPIEKAYFNYIELVRYIKNTYTCKLYVLNLYYPMDESMKKYYETIKKWNNLLIEIPNKEKIEINIIDISKIITKPTDLVNKIEPSITGGLKIANHIIKMVHI